MALNEIWSAGRVRCTTKEAIEQGGKIANEEHIGGGRNGDFHYLRMRGMGHAICPGD